MDEPTLISRYRIRTWRFPFPHPNAREVPPDEEYEGSIQDVWAVNEKVGSEYRMTRYDWIPEPHVPWWRRIFRRSR